MHESDIDRFMDRLTTALQQGIAKAVTANPEAFRLSRPYSLDSYRCPDLYGNISDNKLEAIGIEPKRKPRPMPTTRRPKLGP